MKKRFNIGYNGEYRDIILDIKFNAGLLSISGHGHGVGGQMNDTIKELAAANEIEYSPEWNKEKLMRVLSIWEAWHLNDMHLECEHQAALGWREQASEVITTYGWRLSPEVSRQKSKLEEEALERAKSVSGTTVGFHAQERKIMRLEQFIETSSAELDAELSRYYVACSKEPGTAFPHIKKEIRGWINFKNDARGILCKPCPECSYQYGSAWKRVEVPQDIINYLFDLK